MVWYVLMDHKLRFDKFTVPNKSAGRLQLITIIVEVNGNYVKQAPYKEITKYILQVVVHIWRDFVPSLV